LDIYSVGLNGVGILRTNSLILKLNIAEILRTNPLFLKFTHHLIQHYEYPLYT